MFTYEAHSPKKRKNNSWFVCDHCGLVYLNNNFTRWAIKNGCNNRDHPNYEVERKKAWVNL
jgi:hypothetical protein